MKLRRRGGGGDWRRFLPERGDLRLWLLVLGAAAAAFAGGYLVAAQVLFPPTGQAVDAPLVSVPEVQEIPADEARARLEERGLEASVALRPASMEADSGTVIGQRPMAGRMVRSGDTVGLTVSRGAGVVRVPGLRGLAEDRARSILEDLSLEVRTRREPSSVRSGEVVGTEPAAGSRLRPPARISLVISEGPEVARVPDLVGRHIDDVPRILREANLELGAVEFDPGATAAPGRVVGQSPPPAFALRRGGSVSVRVAGSRGDWSRPEPPGGGTETTGADSTTTPSRGG